ncbi:hypothetical protein [Acinetobacter oleivorans]|uniref:Uncharacterized protein n=1 Tax=Acinetobacter oleivorans (strain JCM 16667 / KCTC 23045 / DR1) TaxID=436717 RepID=A0AAN0UCL9_ACISD|nr:hypothetical protein [Acinetobacter oleivorans]ADI90196.1 hypothetical protein AOLE_06515 [Acinetobacter oleivorans DR1]ESK46671.1 hypothetical protein P254_00560 [Acinetobacter oleivorans CIP 110421]WQF74181.1 hypothetical protein OKW95_06615 [Acinetobacter oleivorans]
MKSILNIEKNIFELENILNKKQKIEELESSIQQLFSLILKDYPYLKLPTFSIIPTRALEFIVWYQDPNAITETLLIKQNSFTAYLWRCDDEKWYLDDLYSEPREIASKLIKHIPVFYSIPENPKEVKHLLEIGIMHFNEILFPIFSNRTLEDSREVLTWDDHFLLVGTQLTNLKLYSHEEWNALIDRENSYLN